MSNDDFPEARSARPLWLMTLADLALLLVGFFVFVQASQHLDKRALARGIREGFGVHTAGTTEPMPVAAAAMLDFASGSAALPSSPDSLIAWAREATRDPRVMLRISGAAGGSIDDVDPGTGSGAVLAADRARAVAAAIAAAHAAPAGRMTIVGAPEARRGQRAVTITLAFASNRPSCAGRQSSRQSPLPLC